MATRKTMRRLSTTRLTRESRAYSAAMADSQFGLQSPWVIFHKGIYNLFTQDPDITVEPTIRKCGDGLYETHISSSNFEKLNALKKIIKNEIQMGNILVRVIFDYDAPTDSISADDWKTAFEGNPLFKDIVSVPTPTGGAVNYVLFTRDILTYFVDDVTDLYGNKHIIVADLVKQVVNETIGINICTEYNEDADE
jgi:hypothetical protein